MSTEYKIHYTILGSLIKSCTQVPKVLFTKHIAEHRCRTLLYYNNNEDEILGKIGKK
jgi:hypothetical protein